jgi:hypothetical protein
MNQPNSPPSDSPIDYPKGLTFEKVWASIQELGKKYDAYFERIAEERIKDAEERIKESEKRIKESEESRKDHEAAIERLKKLEKFVEKTSRSLDDTNKKVGHLDLRFGELIEHLIAAGIADRFREVGYCFDDVTHPFGFKFKQDGVVIAQADILLENQDTIMIVEVKSKPDDRDVQNFMTKIYAVRRYYEQDPTAKNKRLIGALAGAIFPKHVKLLAVKSGFFAVTQRGDTVKIDVPKGFEPRKF